MCMGDGTAVAEPGPLQGLRAEHIGPDNGALGRRPPAPPCLLLDHRVANSPRCMIHLRVLLPTTPVSASLFPAVFTVAALSGLHGGPQVRAPGGLRGHTGLITHDLDLPSLLLPVCDTKYFSAGLAVSFLVLAVSLQMQLAVHFPYIQNIGSWQLALQS